MTPRVWLFVLLLLCLAAAVGCDKDEGEEVTGVQCPQGPIFTHHVIDPDSVQNIDPLGNLNPPGHTFPSDHGGYYIAVPPPGKETYNVQFYCPGDLTCTRLVAVEHVNAGITDFSLDFEACADITVVMGHIASLNPDVFGATADYTQWGDFEEYTTGGETYRRYMQWTRIEIAAGERLGTAGGNPGQGGLDFGIHDLTAPAHTAANPGRWYERYLHSFHFIEYYADGPVKERLIQLLNREVIPDDPHPYGYNMQDVPGTAHG
ncbi:MAG: hypothetical protein ABIF77_08270, partial [bacterium]